MRRRGRGGTPAGSASESGREGPPRWVAQPKPWAPSPSTCPQPSTALSSLPIFTHVSLATTLGHLLSQPQSRCFRGTETKRTCPQSHTTGKSRAETQPGRPGALGSVTQPRGAFGDWGDGMSWSLGSSLAQGPVHGGAHLGTPQETPRAPHPAGLTRTPSQGAPTSHAGRHLLGTPLGQRCVTSRPLLLWRACPGCSAWGGRCWPGRPPAHLPHKPSALALSLTSKLRVTLCDVDKGGAHTETSPHPTE